VTKHAYHHALDKLRVCWCTVGCALTYANETVDFDKARIAFISLQESLDDVVSALEHYNAADSAEKGNAGCHLRDTVQELLVAWNVDLVDLVSPELGADADSAINVTNAHLLGDYLRRGIGSDESQRELMEMITHGQGEVAEAQNPEPTLPINAHAAAIREAEAFLLEDAAADKDAEDELWDQFQARMRCPDGRAEMERSADAMVRHTASKPRSKHVQQVKMMEALREIGNLPRISTNVTPELTARYSGHVTHQSAKDTGGQNSQNSRIRKRGV